MIRSIAIIFAFWVQLTAFCQTNYYVDQINGDDNNNGMSFYDAWKTIQKACNTVGPNSVVQIKGGTYKENIVVNVSGTLGNPITFKNYMNDIVYIDGTGTTGKTMLSITNKNYLTFENLIIQNRTANNAQGILLQATGSSTSTGITFKSIIIRNINWTANASAIPNSNNNAQALIVYGGNGGVTDLTIDSCQVLDNILGFSEAISLDGNIDGFVIKDCQVHDNTNIGIALIGNYGTASVAAKDHTRNGVVATNHCYNNVSLYATSGGIYVDGGWDITIERNTCYHNGNGIELGCEENGTTENILVKNNVVYDNQIAGMYIGGYTTATTGQVLNSTVRNNTFFKNNYANDGTGELAISKATNCIIENNIFYTSSQKVFMSVDKISPQSNNSLNYNCWYTPSNNANDITVNWRSSTYSKFSTYQTATSQESNSIFSDPDFENTTLSTIDLHVQGMSPVINAGNAGTVTDGGEIDYDGNARLVGTAIDMGAYEFAGTIITSTTSGLNNIEYVIYPNPFISDLFVNAELHAANFVLYDNVGNVVIQLKDVSGKHISINRDVLTDGMYVYEIIEETKTIARGKLIAQ